MSDPTTIEQRVRAENPWFAVSEGGASWTVSPEEFPDEYEAMIADRVVLAIQAEAATIAETERRSTRDQVRLALATLTADLEEASTDFAALPNATTLAQLRAGLIRAVDRQRHLERVSIGLIRVLIDRALIERDEP